MARKPNRARGDWAKQMRLDMAFAQKALLKDGEVMPMFVIHGSAETIVVGTPWESDAGKDRARAMVRLACIAHDAQALSQITEAWVRSYERYAGETEAEFDARSERRANGKPYGLKPLSDGQKMDQMSGQMVEILPSRPPTPLEREAAKTLLAMAREPRG